MDMQLKEKFVPLWRKYFNQAELPITFYYSEELNGAEKVKAGSVSRCIIGALNKIRQGDSLAFEVDSIGCPGGRRYTGFSATLAPNFEYFLSCGIPGKVEGERYKKSPEIVKQLLDNWPAFKAPASKIIFKRWDKLEAGDRPDVVIFYAKPDVLSGLYTLASYESADPNAVTAPMGSGCASIIQNPYVESQSKDPRGVIGMFDLSARPHVAPDELTFAVPLSKFARMVNDMEESFLITKTWETIRKRIG
jgi:uncharacterized protein (DUF169 family)